MTTMQDPQYEAGYRAGFKAYRDALRQMRLDSLDQQIRILKAQRKELAMDMAHELKSK